MLSCLLHSGVLPAQQSLRVVVGGKNQQAEREEHQDVFSWQCGIDMLMEIHLMQRGRALKAWRGWWKGETAIAHTGTLALHVFCAGTLQPTGLTTPPLAASPALLASAPEQQNGSLAALSPVMTASATTAVPEWPTLAEAEPTNPPLQHASPPRGELPQEDDLWSVAEADVAGEDYEEPEELKGEEECEELEEEGEADEEEDQGRQEADLVSDEPASVLSAPAGTTLAAARAELAWSVPEHERLLQCFAALLAALPANAIIVDLRWHAPTPRIRHSASRLARPGHARSGPQTMGLSKAVLRTLYGARYWDRSALIQTAGRTEQGHWVQRVTNPEFAEGLGALGAALARGFSLVILDSTASYPQSARFAVIAELRQRVANLTVGPCS
jgi:hypothetical protein